MLCIRLLEMVVNEYITIVEHLEQKKDIENNRIIIEREEFKELLNKYAYITFKQKTKIYKQLNFIVHDKNNYTLPCKIDNKKTERKVVINYETYLTLKPLYDILI